MSKNRIVNATVVYITHQNVFWNAEIPFNAEIACVVSTGIGGWPLDMAFSRSLDKILFVHGSGGDHGFPVKKRKSICLLRVRKAAFKVLEKTMGFWISGLPGKDACLLKFTRKSVQWTHS